MNSFLLQQPHPETNHTACINLSEGAQPLQPVVDVPADTCCAAFYDNRYHMLIVETNSSGSIQAYEGERIDRLHKKNTLATFADPITSLRYFCWNDEWMVAVCARSVYILRADGTRFSDLPVQALSATFYCEGDQAVLVYDGKIRSVSSDLSTLLEEETEIEAEPCKFNPVRFDALYQENRTKPGSRGGDIVKFRGLIYYFCADSFDRSSLENVDTFVCVSDKLKGPYSRRYLVLPNGGQVSVFHGPDGELYAAFVGATSYSVVHQRPAIVRLDLQDGEFWRPDPKVVLEQGAVARLQPSADVKAMRDSFILNAPDGYYYLTGSTKREGGTYWKHSNGICLWRSKDLKQYEFVGKVFDYTDKEDTWQRHISEDLICWAPEICYFNDTYWITYTVFPPGCGLLKSTSGKIEGPYADLGRVVCNGIDSGFFIDDDGSFYLVYQNGKIVPLRKDGKVTLKDPVLLMPEDNQHVGYEGAGLIKVRGKYVLYAAEWNGDKRIDGTYDMMYSVSDQLNGPYRPRKLLVPHGGHGSLFYDKEGALRFSMFGNDRTAPFRHSVAVGYIDIVEEGQELILRVADY